MQNNFFRYTLAVLISITFIFSDHLIAIDNPDSKRQSIHASADIERLFFETNDIESSDAVITDHLIEQFPLITNNEISKIILTKSISKNQFQSQTETYDSSSAAISEYQYKVTFEVPKNYLADTAKIFWVLNIPSFESKIYQLYDGEQIYLDTWPNVVGKIGTKTYTGNFQAYKVRNWPFYKDPDPDKASLPPTKPGPGNPLGLFVVHYDENSLRYFHGTNMNKLLSNKMRNLSHGCVRNDNGNIEKMKQFLIKRVIKSKDLSGWLNSKKTLEYYFEEIDKFPVQITYKTFEFDKDGSGDYIILYKDVYGYSDPEKIDTELNEVSLVTLSTRENIVTEYQKIYGTGLSAETLNTIADYVLNDGKLYNKYYIEDLKQLFFSQN